MIVEAEGLRGPYDVIIVGAGAVGLAMGADLSRAGKRVLVLEAGRQTVTEASQAVFAEAANEGANLHGLYAGRYRALGGSTTFWGGQLVPLGRHIFEDRPWVSPQGWPIGWSDVEPYYDKARSLLGMNATLREDSEVWPALGVAPPPQDDSVQFFFSRWMPIRNFATFFRKDIDGAALDVAVDAQVVSLEGRSEGSAITGVTVRTRRGDPVRVAAGHVVLACGTVEIARLLLQPLADGSVPLWSRHGWLGRGFMDHIEGTAGSVHVLDKQRFHQIFDNAVLKGVKYSPRLRLAAPVQMREHRLDVGAHFHFASSLGEHLELAKLFAKSLLHGSVSSQGIPRIGDLLSVARVSVPLLMRYLRSNRIHNLSDLGIFLRVVTEQKPCAESRIRLLGDLDQTGVPRVAVDWRISRAELESLCAFAETVAAYLTANGLARVELNPLVVARDEAFLSKCFDTYHHMGGARMSVSHRDGVVDADLRVHGTRNLFVAGAAVFPSSGFPNCTFTAVALGLRLSQMLQQDRFATVEALHAS